MFNGTSGKFGVRLHAGPHYPRSSATRKSCQQGSAEFRQKYPQLINEHEYSIYGLGKLDANNEPSKVNQQQFRGVCEESKHSHEVALDQYGYQHLFTATDLEEPSILVC